MARYIDKNNANDGNISNGGKGLVVPWYRSIVSLEIIIEYKPAIRMKLVHSQIFHW